MTCATGPVGEPAQRQFPIGSFCRNPGPVIGCHAPITVFDEPGGAPGFQRLGCGVQRLGRCLGPGARFDPFDQGLDDGRAFGSRELAMARALDQRLPIQIAGTLLLHQRAVAFHQRVGNGPVAQHVDADRRNLQIAGRRAPVCGPEIARIIRGRDAGGGVDPGNVGLKVYENFVSRVRELTPLGD
mgnify:CR=1 FL=1